MVNLWSRELRRSVASALFYLKAEFGAAQVGLVFLPEGVWFDQQRRVDVGGKRLLQRP